MEINSARPAGSEVASNAAVSTEQVDRFNQRKAIEAQSDVKSEAIFFSPVIRIDKDTQSTVIQYRDPTTGAVTREYPDKAKVNAYEHAQDTAKAIAKDESQDHVISVIHDDAAPAVKAPVKQDSAPVVSQAAVSKPVAQQPPVQKSQDPVVDQQA
jgi:hypothetical protein